MGFIDLEVYNKVNMKALWQVLRMYEYMVELRICMLIV